MVFSFQVNPDGRYSIAIFTWSVGSLVALTESNPLLFSLAQSSWVYHRATDAWRRHSVVTYAWIFP